MAIFDADVFDDVVFDADLASAVCVFDAGVFDDGVFHACLGDGDCSFDANVFDDGAFDSCGETTAQARDPGTRGKRKRKRRYKDPMPLTLKTWNAQPLLRGEAALAAFDAAGGDDEDDMIMLLLAA